MRPQECLNSIPLQIQAITSFVEEDSVCGVSLREGTICELHAEGRGVGRVNSEATGVVVEIVQRLGETTGIVGSSWFRSAILGGVV